MSSINSIGYHQSVYCFEDDLEQIEQILEDIETFEDYDFIRKGKNLLSEEEPQLVDSSMCNVSKSQDGLEESNSSEDYFLGKIAKAIPIDERIQQQSLDDGLYFMSKISRFFEKAQKSFVSEEDRFTIVDFEDLAEENRILACRVKHAFDRCMDVFDISYEKVLLPAALTGDSNLLDCILSFSSLPDLDIAETFVQLAASGKFHLMELIVSNKVEIEENDWGRAVVFAAQNGHSDVVRYIFSMKERISQQNLHWALNEAIKERQKEVFEILMSKTQHLQSCHLNSLCSTAISYDQVQMLSILLSDPCRLDQYYLWKLLINEAACADLPMIELIFSKLQKSDSENFKLALEQAVDHDNLPAFQFFCRKKILTQKQKEYFLLRAQQQSSHKIISFLHF